MILPKDKDFKELKETLKFTKANGQISPIILEKSKVTNSKIPDSETSSWNILGISENTSGVNFIGLNEKSNPWEPSKEKLISPSEMPESTSNIIIMKITMKTSESSETTNRPLKNIYKGTSTFRFRLNIEDNPFVILNMQKEVTYPSSFPTWTTIDDTFYYNFIKNKDKGSAKRKITFDQTFTTQSPSILNG